MNKDNRRDKNSDISDVDSEELAKMVKDVDEMDNALFRLKPNQEDVNKVSKVPSTDIMESGARNTSIKTATKDLGIFGDDLLADISLSDDDFYDIGRKDPITFKTQEKENSSILKKEEEKLAKAKKIANLFGLEADEEKMEIKKKDSVSDWLGIKENTKESAPVSPGIKENKKASASDWLGIKENIKEISASDSHGIKENKKESASDWLGIKESMKENASDSLGIKENKKASASDWLGIKNSPVKLAAATTVAYQDTLAADTSRTSLTNIMGLPTSGDSLPLQVENKEVQLKTEEQSINVSRPTSNQIKADLAIPRQRKHTDIFDSLNESRDLIADKSKEKQSTVVDELFGGTINIQNNPSRRNSLPRNPSENVNTETSEDKDGKEASGQFNLSSGARRPGLGRRRTTPSTPPTLATLSFQEDWLTPTSQNENTKETTQVLRSEVKKTNAVADNSLLPSWLGGTSTRPQTAKVNPDTSSPTKKLNKQQTGTTNPLATNPSTDEVAVKTQDEQTTKVVSEVLSSNSEQNQKTVSALQRTEAQLRTALELHQAQSSLESVCARQRGILDMQERRLAELVTRQTNKQTLVERQLADQQHRIDLLLEVLSNNAPSLSAEENVYQNHDKTFLNTPSERQKVVDLEREVHAAQLENEALRQRLKLMEKHYKLEFESYHLQYRREVESLELQLEKEKEHGDQISDDFKERITQLKEREAELVGEHNERVLRLRQERADDLNQLTEYHKVALDQLLALSKQIVSSVAIREEQTRTIPERIVPLDPVQISEKEEDLIKKEKMLTALQLKLENEKEANYKELGEMKESLQQEKFKTEDLSRHLQHEQSQLKYQLQQLNLERKHMEEHNHAQRKVLEEMQEKIMGQQTEITKERLNLAEEKARLDALAQLQGVSSSASFDVLQAKAEVNGALEAARTAESQAQEERQRLRDKERELDSQKWKLRQAEHDLANRALQLDDLLKVSENKEETAIKALEEAKLFQKKAEEMLREVEKRKIDLREKEQNLMRMKLEMAHEEVRLNRKKEQLEHILPQLTTEEALSLHPIKGVVDPKILIMKLRAEREMDAKQPNIIVEN